MRDPKQLWSKWIHRKESTTANPPTTPASGSHSTNNSTPKPVVAEEPTNTGEAVLDNLSLALSLAEQVAEIAQAAPFIAPAASLLSKILKLYNIYFIFYVRGFF
jgi:hypothetical protein